MQTERISEHIKAIDNHFRSEFVNTEYERILSRTVKLGEEVGELCEAVLNENNELREDKVVDLPSEIADVMICVLMIANLKEVDVWGEVEKKLEDIRRKRGI